MATKRGAGLKSATKAKKTQKTRSAMTPPTSGLLPLSGPEPEDPAILSPRRLRRLAESAAGRPDVPLKMVLLEQTDQHGAGWFMLEKDEPEGGAGIPVNMRQATKPGTVQGKPPWAPMAKVELTYGKTTRHDIAPKCDALFWSPMAIEKFVISYYLPLMTPEEWLPLYHRLSGKVEDDVTVYGIAHTYPSIDFEVKEDDTTFHTSEGPIPGSQFLAKARELYRVQVTDRLDRR